MTPYTRRVSSVPGGWDSQRNGGFDPNTGEPYTLAKDRRTGHETGNVQAVLDGDLLPFVEMYLHWKLKGGKPRQSKESGNDD